MAQKTTLQPYALPGQTRTFVAKTAVVITGGLSWRRPFNLQYRSRYKYNASFIVRGDR